MQRRFPLFAACCAISTATFAAPPHVHGAGNLELVIDGGQFAVTLDMPADNAVGFEHPPRNAGEKAAVEAMMKVLNDGPALFKPSAGTQCRLTSADISTPFFAAAAHAKGGDDHGDIEASYIFQCAQPAALKGLETTIFTRFKRLNRLNVQRAGPGGQGGGSLSAKQPALNW